MSENLKTIAAVARHVKANGFKVTDKTVRNHVDRRYLIPENDGTFAINDVDRYALRHLKRTADTANATKGAEIDRWALRKMKAETLHAEARATKAKAEANGYVRREEMEVQFEQELAGRAVLYDNGMQHRIHINAAQIIQIVGGDSGKVDELVEFQLQQHEEQLTQFANTEHYLVIVASDE